MKEMKELIQIVKHLKKGRSNYVSHGELGNILYLLLISIAPKLVKEAEEKLNCE